ncbi:MAG: amidohydrolase [Oscillospiraceae bacterium]|nr:amidohydrolase [Oscillospiraceae bacterium]
MDTLQKQTREQAAYVSALRQELHRHPELSLQEYRTAQVIERELDRAGIAHSRIGATGVLGILKGEKPGGRVIALRADIDALPIQEQNTSDHRSREAGRMHACGHDAHIAILLGAAQVLAQRRDTFGGEVRFLFQPAEEIGRGAEDFLAAGALDGVGRVFGMHVAPDLPAGTVGLKPGLNNAAVDGFRIVVQGKSAHVSAPEQGIDALYIASHIVVALQAQVARRTSPVEPVILGIGTFHSGTTYNALAETAELEGTTRTVSAASRAKARDQVNETAAGIAALYGGTAEVIWDDITSALINDPAASGEVKELVRTYRPELTAVTDRALALSGDNFAEFLLKTPGVYAYLGTSDPDRPETQNPIHSSRFELDEAALEIGVWLHAAYAEWWLKS